MQRSDEYFAGLFDGEGSVGIYAVGASSYGVRLSLNGTHLPMMQAACDHFGIGAVRRVKRQNVRLPNGVVSPAAQTRPGYRWTLTKKSEILEVLQRVRPCLIEKTEQADIVIRHLKGELGAEEASLACKEAKRFSFGDFEEPAKRSTGSPGESNPNARLTYAKAQTVRERVKAGERQADVARDMGISKSMVSRIVKGKTYNVAPMLAGAD